MKIITQRESGRFACDTPLASDRYASKSSPHQGPRLGSARLGPARPLDWPHKLSLRIAEIGHAESLGGGAEVPAPPSAGHHLPARSADLGPARIMRKLWRNVNVTFICSARFIPIHILVCINALGREISDCGLGIESELEPEGLGLEFAWARHKSRAKGPTMDRLLI